MSIEALNWALKQMQDATMPSSTRFVLIILANRADPEGVCWPSLRYISVRTGLSERTIRNSCNEIEARKLMAIEPQQRVDGGKTSNRYLLRLETPPPATIAGAPPGNHCPTPGNHPGAPPATIAGHKTKDINKESNTKNNGAVAPLILLTDLGVDEQVAKDWIGVRKAKRAGPVTDTVVKALQREAEAAGISVPEAVRICAERGWQGFKAEWMKTGIKTTDHPSQTRQAAQNLAAMRRNL